MAVQFDDIRALAGDFLALAQQIQKFRPEPVASPGGEAVKYGKWKHEGLSLSKL